MNNSIKQYRFSKSWQVTHNLILTQRMPRFNQHLSPGALLVEVGSHGNTLQEALTAARLFAGSFAQTLRILSADEV